MAPRRSPLLVAISLALAACGPGTSASRPTVASSPQPSVSLTPTVSPAPTVDAAATPIALAVGGRILFSSNRQTGHSLYIVNADGTGLRALPFPVAAGAPALSPDGRSVAFSTDVVSVATLDGTDLRTIRAGPGMTATEPAWASDGRRVAFIEGTSSGGVGDERLAIVDLASGSVSVLSVLPSGDRPGWSPDGTGIVYGNGDNGGLAVVTLAGGAIRRLTSDDDGFASFSPDGRRLVFERGDPPDASGNQVHHIMVSQADGTGVRQLTFGAADDEYPAWSPDGSWIAFARLDSHGGWALWRVSVEGSAPVRITPGSAADLYPTWGP